MTSTIVTHNNNEHDDIDICSSIMIGSRNKKSTPSTNNSNNNSNRSELLPSLSRLSSTMSTTSTTSSWNNEDTIMIQDDITPSKEQDTFSVRVEHIIIRVVENEYFGAYIFLLLHLLLIALGVIDNESMFATGTVTCHTYFCAWCIIYYLRTATRRRCHQKRRVFHESSSAISTHVDDSYFSDSSESDNRSRSSSRRRKGSRTCDYYDYDINNTNHDTNRNNSHSNNDTIYNDNTYNNNHDLKEGGMALVLLFQLAIGAGAFSRVYYGPLRTTNVITAIFGKDTLQDRGDLFQSLLVKMIHNDSIAGSGSQLMNWFIQKIQVRYSAPWFLSEIVDVLGHQVPFLLMCFLISKHNNHGNNQAAARKNWNYIVSHEIQKYWYAFIFLGPIHRTTWDFVTCGHTFCDGPYHGMLKIIPNTHQFCWHFVPCLCIVSYLILTNHHKVNKQK